jgi:transcriptional regulator with XRE-family HTH domain
MSLYSSNFSQVFSELLDKAKVSCYQVGQYTHLNEGYLSRLKNGEKQNPSLDTIIKICLALAQSNKDIKLHDIQRLFKSVGRYLKMRDDLDGY